MSKEQRCTCDACDKVGHCKAYEPCPPGWYWLDAPLYDTEHGAPCFCSRKCLARARFRIHRRPRKRAPFHGR